MTTALGSYNPSMAPQRHATAPADAMGLRPGGVVEGRARIPGSKSEAQRAIVAASLAHGTTEIVGLPDGADVLAALALVHAAGSRITGRPPGSDGGWSASAPVSAGESGTLARFATAAFALCGKRGAWQEIRVEGTLRGRRSPALFAALREVGADIVCSSVEGSFPVRVRSAGAATNVRIVAPTSSQEVSALWIALAAREGPSTLAIDGPVPSRPYLELTRRSLAAFGAHVEGPTITGPLRAPAGPIAIEPDASSAAVVLAAARLSGGRVHIDGLNPRSAQPDACAAELLARFDDGGGADLDLSGAPDLAPVLAAVAGAAALRQNASSRLGGLGTLPGKESSRIEVLARGLEALGLSARAGRDVLEIGPGRGARTAEVRLDPAGDHRMAFAFALLGLVADGVWVLDPGCVGKSWPGFWDELARLGARVATSA
ncbi:MAG TPA: hypothetical protein VGR31_03235 [Planctomycetota bacterium]|nr:hypothetical protein [Planctomycetota bacterium]